jgi:hypothetical protein
MMNEVLELQVIEHDDPSEVEVEAPITDGSGVSFTC